MCNGLAPARAQAETKAGSVTISIKSTSGPSAPVVVSSDHLVLDVMERCSQFGPPSMQTLIVGGRDLRPGRRVGSIPERTWFQRMRLGGGGYAHCYYHHSLTYKFVGAQGPGQVTVLGIECHRPLVLPAGSRVSSVAWCSQSHAGRQIPEDSVNGQTYCVRDGFGRRVAAGVRLCESTVVQNDYRAHVEASVYSLDFEPSLAASSHWLTLNADMNNSSDHQDTRATWQHNKWAAVVGPILLELLAPRDLVDLCQSYDCWVGFGDEEPFASMRSDTGEPLPGCLVQEICPGSVTPDGYRKTAETSDE